MKKGHEPDLQAYAAHVEKARIHERKAQENWARSRAIEREWCEWRTGVKPGRILRIVQMRDHVAGEPRPYENHVLVVGLRFSGGGEQIFVRGRLIKATGHLRHDARESDWRLDGCEWEDVTDTFPINADLRRAMEIVRGEAIAREGAA